MKGGHVVISQAKGGALLREGRQPATTANQRPEAGSFDAKQSFGLDKDEVIYGLGQQQSGKLNQHEGKLRQLFGE